MRQMPASGPRFAICFALLGLFLSMQVWLQWRFEQLGAPSTAGHGAARARERAGRAVLGDCLRRSAALKFEDVRSEAVGIEGVQKQLDRLSDMLTAVQKALGRLNEQTPPPPPCPTHASPSAFAISCLLSLSLRVLSLSLCSPSHSFSPSFSLLLPFSFTTTREQKRRLPGEAALAVCTLLLCRR